MPIHRSTDSRYGWVLVAGGLVSIGCQSAIFFSTALLLAAIPDETGWSRAATAAALSSLVLGHGAWAPVVGTLIQRCDLRRVMPASAVILASGFVGLSLARSPEELGAAMLLLIAPGTIGVGSLANYTAIQAWFRERRGTALSLADSGASLGLMLLVPLIQQLILAFGWRSACQVLAVAALAQAPLHLLIQRPPPVRGPTSSSLGRPPERAAGLIELLRDRRLGLIGLGQAASRFAVQLVSFHQVVYLLDRGFEPSAVASAFALTGLAGLVGRPGFGWLSDRIGVTPVYGLLTGCVLVGISSLVVAGQSGLMLPLWLYAISFGAALGVATLLSARQLSDLVGSRSFGSAMGLSQAIGSLGGAAGATSAGLVYDATGSYLTSFAAAAIMALLSFGCMWSVGRSLRGAGALPGAPARTPA